MIYVLKESVMNGSVTMNTIITGVEADDFRLALMRVRTKLMGMKHVRMIVEDENEQLQYEIAGQEFIVYGVMDSEPLKMFGETNATST